MKKNLLTLFVLLMTAATGAWAENVAIGTKAEWDAFAANVNNGMSYSGQTVVLTADIGSEQDPITEMVGGMKVNGFAGTFDGCGHTIHVNITSDGEHVAPFRFISGATIKNVRVTGSVEGGIHCAGLVGAAEGGTTCFIRNCEVAASITCSKSHCGGVLGHGLTSDTTISNCLFSGSITGTTSATGIFYGWGDGGGSHKVSNCLSAGTYEGCAGVDLGNVISSASISVVLSFRKTSGGTQGDDASQMSATELAGVLNFGFLHEWQVDGNGNVVPIMLTNSLEQDAEGYYLLGSVDDWKIFASLVQTTPTANAKMTADIDLGDDQTMIGTESIPYQGSFDGQGHTLTVTYNTSENSIAPFRYVSGEAQTIENLHVDGSIITSGCAAGGIACAITGNLTIKNCWVSAQIQTGGSDGAYGTIGGICSYCDPTEGCTIIIEDCLFSGAILYADYCGSFMSHVGSSYSSVTMRRGLSIGTWSGGDGYQSGTFIRPVLNGVRNLETETLFYRSNWGEVQGTPATDAELADGTITAALGDVWVQQGSQPMLKVFCDGDALPYIYTTRFATYEDEETGIRTTWNGEKAVGNGKFAATEEEGEPFSDFFQNDGSAVRTSYCLLPEDVLAHSDKTHELTIAFWVSAKGFTPDQYTYAPLFTAYAQKNNPNTYPMLALQSRGNVQVNCNGWCDFTGANNVEGKNNIYNSNAWEANDDNYNDAGNWLEDEKWHYYTAVFTDTNVKVYLDGEVKNEWEIDGVSDGQKVGGLFTNGSSFKYVCLGGNQAWDWNDIDSPFRYARLLIQNSSMTPDQIKTQMTTDFPDWEDYLNDEPDAVEDISVTPQNENDVLYNTAGQQVDDDYQGIVIKNGKKYFKRW